MIDIPSTFKISLRALRVNKMRSALTMPGIIIGDTIFTPLAMAQKKIFGTTRLGMVCSISVKAKSADHLSAAERQIIDLPRQRRSELFCGPFQRSSTLQRTSPPELPSHDKV